MGRTDPPRQDGGGDVVLRPALAHEAAVLASVQVAARRAGPMPPPACSDDVLAARLAERLGLDETWVAEVAGSVAGYARATPTWLDDLYVDPAHSGQGLGSALLEVVKATHAGGFSLWVFEVNLPARRFYARHGLLERERTDGSQNEEREPELRLEWRPSSVAR